MTVVIIVRKDQKKFDNTRAYSGNCVYVGRVDCSPLFRLKPQLAVCGILVQEL